MSLCFLWAGSGIVSDYSGTHSLAPLTKRYLIVLFGRVLLNPDGFSRFVRLFALTGLLAIARYCSTENPLEPI